jgi:hypothetical protein
MTDPHAEYETTGIFAAPPGLVAVFAGEHQLPPDRLPIVAVLCAPCVYCRRERLMPAVVAPDGELCPVDQYPGAKFLGLGTAADTGDAEWIALALLRHELSDRAEHT